MTLWDILPPILAHGDVEQVSMSELMFSVGLLVLSGGLAAGLFLAIFIKPILRVRKQWKEGKLPSSNKSIYLVACVVILGAFLWILYQFSMAVYYDYHFEKFEQVEKESGKHVRGGAEFKWKRWHINGRYQPDKLILVVDDVLRSADPGRKIKASAREIGPTPTDWRPMEWNAEKKAFTAKFKPEGERMDFEFELSSGLSHYTESIIGYIPKVPGGGATSPEGHDKHDGHGH
jgi:amino acid transporter